MKLIVGLGNPGKEYEMTRHNIGFNFIDFYLQGVSYKEKFESLIYEKNINGERVIFLKPLTYMNESGRAVKKVKDYFKINLEDILLIYDDMDFDVGTFKLRKNGSAAGHNGVKSVIQYLGTEEFKRIRIGISREKENKVDYVLGKFDKTDEEKLKIVFKQVSLIINDFMIMDFDRLMSKYN